MTQAIGWLAAVLGYTARFVLALVRFAISAAGPVLVVYGAWLMWRPLAFIVAGGVFFLLDRRVS